MASTKATERYEALRAKGCTCGGENVSKCPIHTKVGDNRGIRAWAEAGMPAGFPSAVTCSVCRAGALMYPNIEIANPKGSGEYRPTTVCPNCSAPPCERRLVDEAQAFGYLLNDNRVFGGVAG